MIKNNREKKDNQWSFKELPALIVRKQFIRGDRFGVKIGVSKEKNDNVIMNDKKGGERKNHKGNRAENPATDGGKKENE